MKRIAIACLLLLSASVLCEGKEIKILYWNIQNGMWDDQQNNYSNFVEYVKSLDPDICIWAEAESLYHSGSNQKLKKEEQYLPWNWDILAGRYGHRYTLISGKRDSYPQVITSKFPLKIVKRITGDGEDIIVAHGAGWARVELGRGSVLNLVTVHTWPHKYAYGAADKDASAAQNGGNYFRAAEIEYICKETVGTVPQAKGQLWLMAGDFNSISSVDNYHYGNDLSDPVFLVHDYVRANTPYIDLIESLYPGEFKPSTQSGKRIDMVYVTPALFKKVLSAETLYDGFATSVRDSTYTNFCHPSDHYPILVKLKL